MGLDVSEAAIIGLEKVGGKNKWACKVIAPLIADYQNKMMLT